ncbi:MAG: histidine kinase [Cyclobacteriaceae bacterium]
MDRFWKYKLDHGIFWAATVGFHMFTRIDLVGKAGVEHFILETVARNGLLALLIYFNLLVLIPKYVQKGKIVFYTLLLICALTAYVAVKNAHDVYLYGYVLGNQAAQSFFYNSYYNASIAIFYLTFSIALHLSKAWYFQREMIRRMEIEKLNAELDYLKAQINPHFVFNSINTIYFQIDRQNESARRSLSNFSEMLRYQLYECNGSEIPIEKEINYLKNYVALQQMRKDENYGISFVEGEDLKGFVISPLLLIPFVENAFKHVSHFAGRNEIRIHLARRENNFCLSVFNTKENKEMNGYHTGIGLKNAKRRLELLYKDRHELLIENRSDSFEVRLALRISE